MGYNFFHSINGMTIIDKMVSLIQGDSLSKSDPDINMFFELHLGKFLIEAEGQVSLAKAFELDPKNFIQDIAFISFLCDNQEETRAFQNYVYDTYYDYWNAYDMTKGEYFNFIDGVTPDLLIL